MKEKLKAAWEILKVKLTSKVVWAVAGAWVIGQLVNLKLIDTPDTVLNVYNGILTVLTVVGVLNNPNNKSGF